MDHPAARAAVRRDRRLGTAARDAGPRRVGQSPRLGGRSRHCLLRAAYEAHVESGALPEAQFDAVIETPAKRITDAAWWIDNRDTDPDDIQELLEAASRDHASNGTENPY
jgi:hypothetical protein